MRKILIVVAVAFALVAGFTGPAQAWPYPDRAPQVPDAPWQCGIWKVGKYTPACKRWDEHADIFVEVMGHGPGSRRSVTAILALSGHVRDAERAGALAGGESRCGQLIRWQTGHLVNEVAGKKKLAAKMKSVLGVAQRKHGALYFPTADVVFDAAANLAQNHALRQQTRAILFSARTAGCIRG